MKATVITGVVIALVVIAAVYLLSRGSSVSNPSNQSVTNPPSPQTQGIQNDSNLTSISNDLDNADLTSLDSELNQNDTDSLTF